MKTRSAVVLVLLVSVAAIVIWRLGTRTSAAQRDESGSPSGATHDGVGLSRVGDEFAGDNDGGGETRGDGAEGRRRTVIASSHGKALLDARVLVVDDRKREPLVGAHLRWWTNDACGSGTTDAAGSVAVPAGKIVAWASAPGFQDCLYVDDTARESTIALPLAAGLELVFRSGRGANSAGAALAGVGVAGIEVQALLNIDERALAGVPGAQEHVLRRLAQSPDVHAIRRAELEACAGPIALSLDGWKATSDATGRATWRSLPAGSWRWLLLSNHPVRLEPAFETSTFDFRDGQAVWRTTPGGTSGAFELVAGATLRIDVDVAGPTSLTGRLTSADGLPAAGVRVLLRRVEQHADPLGMVEAVGMSAVVGEARSSPEGAFTFERLDPGSFELTAVRVDEAQHFEFATAQAEVTEGEQRDVGVLTLGGAALSGRVDLVDASTGALLDPKAVSAKPGQELLVGLIWLSPHVSEELSVAVGKPFEIRGLEPGQHSASVDVYASGWSIKSSYSIIGDKPRITFEVPGIDRPLALAIPLTKCAHVRLRGRVGAPARNPWSVQGRLVACVGSRATKFSSTLPGVDLDTSIELAPGEYWLYVKAALYGGATTSVLQRVDIPAEGAEYTLAFEPGVDISGIAVSSGDGAALPGKLIFAATTDAPSGSWFFGAQADERGEFSLRGLPANARIRFTRSTDVIDTGTAGVAAAIVHFSSTPR